MKALFPSNNIYVAHSTIPNAGRGVFACQLLKKNDLIERCPIIELPERDVPALRETDLLNYYFLWGKRYKRLAICLGFGSLYNHSYEPNATYKKRLDDHVIEFIALRRINKDEEITVNYNSGNPDDKSPLWMKRVPPFKK